MTLKGYKDGVHVDDVDIIEVDSRTNNEIGSDVADDVAKHEGHSSFAELYIKELYEMRDTLKKGLLYCEDTKEYSKLIKERRSVLNEIEKVSGVKKTPTDIFVLGDIRSKDNNIYLK